MNSERTAQLQVALASYDLKELRVQKRYLQEQGTAIDCTCFCSGEKLLAQLRQGVRYDAVVLCSELTDLPAEQFVRQFYQLKERPMLLIQSHGRSSGTALQKLREQFDTSVAAVESGIRRMVDQLEEEPPLAWLAFKADTRLGSGKPTTGKLIYAVRDVVLRQKVPSTRL